MHANQKKGQTKCRNELSLQNGKAISELGLDFVIIFTSLPVFHISQNPTNKVHTVSFYIILCHTTKLCPLLFASLFYTLTFRRGVAFLVVSSLLSTKPDELKQTIQQVPTSIRQATLRQSVGTSYLFKKAKPSASWD